MLLGPASPPPTIVLKAAYAHTRSVLAFAPLFVSEISEATRTVFGCYRGEFRGMHGAFTFRGRVRLLTERRCEEFLSMLRTGALILACDAFLSIANDTSGDGKVVVGDARNGCSLLHAFRWEESTGMVDLG